MWCARVLATSILLSPTKREAQRTQPILRNHFIDRRRLFLTDGSGTLMSVMLSWLAYGKYITMNSGNKGVVTWSADKQMLIYQGARIELALFQQIILDLVQETTDILWE